MAGEQDEQKKAGLEKALEVGLKKVKLEQAGEPVPDELAAAHAELDEKVLSKIRETLGFDKIVAVNVGAAPTPAEVLEFFHAIGVPVAELWGMSETCGAGAVNPPDKIKIGYVGRPTPGCEIKLADDGEVLIKSRFVMKGYRNLPDKTAETIDDDGWLHTGDIGEFDEDGYLKLVDRKKELIINAGGKNMSPANIEAHVKSSSSLIGQAVAIGDSKPYNVALITLDPDFAPGFIEQNGQDAVQAEVQRGVDAANEKLARVEQIKKFKILDEDWQPGGEELTPTMKLKRKPISREVRGRDRGAVRVVEARRRYGWRRRLPGHRGDRAEQRGLGRGGAQRRRDRGQERARPARGRGRAPGRDDRERRCRELPRAPGDLVQVRVGRVGSERTGRRQGAAPRPGQRRLPFRSKVTTQRTFVR